MPSESSNASWHPAFMPNTEPDIIATKSIYPSQEDTLPSPEPPLEPLKAIPTAPQSNLTVYEATVNDVEVHEPNEESFLGNDGHPELADLRKALTTSLASPGGVEMDSHPFHNGVSKPETAEEEKADFPSEGPPHENKHLSTMSFARTVSEEVNWGEDDEVEAEWNFHRTDTDPFKLMAKSDRTNSFPQVPPAHSNGINHQAEALSHSQAGDILNEVEKASTGLFADEENDGEADFFAQQSAPHDESQHEADTREQNTEMDYGQAYGGDIHQQEDQEMEARYEEGLPLVQLSETQSVDPLLSSSNGAAVLMDNGGDHEDFFAQASKSDPADEEFSEPPSLGRKSTMQVMDSLHFQTREETNEDIIEEGNTESSQSSLGRVTGGGIGVSTSTVLSQGFGDPESPIHDQPENLAALEFDSGEGDLASKWKAALTEDEFLDEDEDLLPDDEPVESTALDPATLFGDDDDGFLEDTEDQNPSEDLFSQKTSPPVLAPPNGRVLEFDNLTGGAHANRPSSSNRPGSSSSRYLPAGATTTVPPPGNSYAPTAPLLADLSRPATSSTSASPYTSPAIQNFPVQQQQQQQPQRPELPKAQSFADKAKGGYSSPYDLPMEVVKPRKRVSMQQMNRGYNTAQQQNVPPPRSSSMYSRPLPPSRGSTASLSPPTSSQSFQPSQLQPSPVASSSKPPPTVKSKGGFFEDLPMSARPKPAVRHSASSSQPGQSQYGPPTAAPPQFLVTTGHQYASTQQQPLQASVPPQGLVAPERVSPYASLSSNNVPPPAVASRYSPAPVHSQSQTAPPPPVSQSRYSPAPPNPRQQMPAYSSPPVNSATPPAPILAHQPRTSSPLAHFERSQEPRSYGAQAETASFDRRSSSMGYESSLRSHHLPPTREVDENEQITTLENKIYEERPNQYSQQPPSHPPHGVRPLSHTPPPQGLASKIGLSPPKRVTSNYLPQQLPSTAGPQAFVPPQRSQTQSPGAALAGPRFEMSKSDPYQRPASVEAPPSPRINVTAFSPIATFVPGRPRGFSQGLNYVAPNDGRENDPMQRWRGAPVFAWGVGGTIITSFPKDVPRYGMNRSVPSIVRSPGEVKIRSIRDVDPLEDRLTSFPGPLKGKSKKKDVVSWLSSGIDMLERNASYLRSLQYLSHEDKRTEERIILWKILRVFIENDGTLEGNAVVDKAVRAVLSPGLDDESSLDAPLYATGADLSGISQSSTSMTRSDPVDPGAIDQLRKHLLRGEREKAVWEAVDKRLWAHAMLISNTVSKELYKQVAQEFVQKEVKNTGDNTDSLAALYEIFAGNFEESIDELVPPSARAGFQMVSTSTATGPSKDSLDGLDRWRETLGLVLSNRSTDDSQALNALGKLLSGYGRAEASHICFLFARTHSVFGGIDDPLSSIVLVGSDQLRQPYDFDREMEPILLSEVFEYGMSLLNTSNVTISSPHLSVYKLQHAKILAEYGYREKALQYCEAIASSITSQTRRSPYHHALLVAELDDLSKRLKQSPKDETSSWISKPSIDKVSGSVWATFNKFVAGDEHDASAAGSTAGSATEVGPFARIAGGTPTISRSPSNSDLYGSYNGGLGINGTLAGAQTTKTSSRYAAGGAYTPPTSHEPQMGSSYDSQSRSSFERSSSEHRRGTYEPQRQMSDYRPNSQPISGNTYTPQTSSNYTPQSSYAPYGEAVSPYAPQQSTPITEQPPPTIYSSPQPLNSFDGQQQHPSSYAPSEPSYESHPSSGYEPPSSSGYEPPSYERPDMDEEPDSPIDTRPKKKSFMDDDEDDIPATKPAPPTREKTKAEKDREADEAFRKAAEADGKHIHSTSICQTNTFAAKRSETEAAAPKKSWGLGGWFGGSKKESADMGAQPNKPIKAKLGEASSFVYDPELKRWVNKKGGGESTPTPSATPPPPPKGPPRTVSGPPGAGPTSAPRPLPISTTSAPPPQRAVSKSLDTAPGTGSPLAQSDGFTTGPESSGLTGPPAMSREASNGSVNGPPSIGPPSRPSTSMSNASSIDDLLGPATGGSRKGTARKAKKGRGYIDVMGEKAA
jgi:hypothetical protein